MTLGYRQTCNQCGSTDVINWCSPHQVIFCGDHRHRQVCDQARTDTEPLRARVAELEGALTFLSTYEKNPPEVMKDDFAYDRLLAFVHDIAARALAAPTPEATDDRSPEQQAEAGDLPDDPDLLPE